MLFVTARGKLPQGGQILNMLFGLGALLSPLGLVYTYEKCFPFSFP